MQPSGFKENYQEKKLDVFMKHYAPGGNKVKETKYF